MTRLVAIAVLVALAVVGVATWRQMALGARAAMDSDAALAKGDLGAAIARARDAAEAAAPGSPYPKRGFDQLASIARDAEAKGDERTAVAAWCAMEAAGTATEGPAVATAAWRTLAENGLARAGSHAPATSAEVHATEAALRAELAGDPRGGVRDVPGAGFLFLLGAGALAFFAGGTRLAWVAREPGAIAAIKRERVALAATAAGLLIYVIASFRS